MLVRLFPDSIIERYRSSHKIARILDISAVCMCIVVLLIICREDWGEPSVGRIHKDCAEYVSAAYHLAKSGVFSSHHFYMSIHHKPYRELLARNGYSDHSPPPHKIGRPGAWGEPLYSMFLVVFMKFSNNLKRLSLDEMLNEKHWHNFIPVVYLQLFMVFLMGLLAMAFVRDITGSRLASFVALFSVCLCRDLLFYSHLIRVEILAGLLLTAASLSFGRAMEKISARRFALTGILFGIMTLIRPQFLYVFPIAAIISMIFACRRSFAFRRVLKGEGLMMLCFAIIVLPWMIRNYYHFSTFRINHMGGFLLRTRLEFNEMTAREFKGAFFRWVPLKITRSLLRPYVSDIDRTPFSRLAGPHDRPRNYDSFYLKGRFPFWELDVRLKNSGVIDNILFKESIKRMFTELPKHLAVSLSLALKGIFMFFGKAWLSVVAFLCFFFLLIRSFVQSDLKVFSTLLPGFGSFLFCALFTVSVSRLQMPLVPLLLASTIIVLVGVSGRFFRLAKYLSIRARRKSFPG